MSYVSFEKSIWFSEFIHVQRGYDLLKTYQPTDVFLEEWEENEDFLTTTTDWNKFIDILFCELLGTDVSWGSSKKELIEQVVEYMIPNDYKTDKKAVKRDMFKFGKLYMLTDVGDYYDGAY